VEAAAKEIQGNILFICLTLNEVKATIFMQFVIVRLAPYQPIHCQAFNIAQKGAHAMPFEMPPLPYDLADLEPVIDALTVEIHYTKHHATYLKNFNAALEKFPQLSNLTVTEILSDLNQIPEDIRTAVRNNGGGFYNHNIYWGSMAPGKGGMPSGKLAAAIDAVFGSFASFKEQYEKAGLGRFGSGYAWLSKKTDGSLILHSTPNQDCPLSEGLTPLLVVDVWEHAYYLKYQNRRAEYLANWWNVVNWEVVANRFGPA
jgi:Fe-Mn family superoxide dismutase